LIRKVGIRRASDGVFVKVGADERSPTGAVNDLRNTKEQRMEATMHAEYIGEHTGKDEILHIGREARKWERTGFEGVEICVMRINAECGATVLMRVAGGSAFPAHSHRGGEELYVLSGRVMVGGLPLKEGDYLWTPPGGVHDLEAETDALLLINAPQGVKIVD
jgi:quercetin dioxygenase-like cupin family protein